NTIDNPERFGNSAFIKMFPGQSSIRINFKKLSVGASTENLWWGPGVRNSLLMSNNAPGFPHLTFNTSAPLCSPIGSFEGQLVSGILKKSGYLPADTTRTYNGIQLFQPKPGGDRYLNGITINWQPKWTKGLYLGFSRVFYIFRSDVQPSFRGYLPIISQLFKGSTSEADREDEIKRDQMLSFFFRLILPKESAEIYAEFGRNDHSGNTRDLLMEPEHSSAFLVGFRKLFQTNKNTHVELMGELTNLQKPSTLLVRAQNSWYSHHQVRDGYTHKGQVIGAGIGSGGNSQTIGVHVIKGLSKTGLQVERVIHNNDFYYDAFSPERDYWRHWVDLSLQLNKSWQHKQFLYDARIMWVRSLNYQWQREFDVNNFQTSLSVSYMF
ncbi:MAG TPA: capsule assembly Wzi family protein, partial [Segetibacter sp.]